MHRQTWTNLLPTTFLYFRSNKQLTCQTCHPTTAVLVGDVQFRSSHTRQVCILISRSRWCGTTYHASLYFLCCAGRIACPCILLPFTQHGKISSALQPVPFSSMPHRPRHEEFTTIELYARETGRKRRISPIVASTKTFFCDAFANLCYTHTTKSEHVGFVHVCV